MKKYRLLKDLPDYKAGHIDTGDNWRREFGWVCKNIPEWFEPVKDRVRINTATTGHPIHVNYIFKYGNAEWTPEEIKGIEAYLNGELCSEMFTKEDIQGFAEWLDDEGFIDYRSDDSIDFKYLVDVWSNSECTCIMHEKDSISKCEVHK